VRYYQLRERPVFEAFCAFPRKALKKEVSLILFVTCFPMLDRPFMPHRYARAGAGRLNKKEGGEMAAGLARRSESSMKTGHLMT